MDLGVWIRHLHTFATQSEAGSHWQIFGVENWEHWFSSGAALFEMNDFPTCFLKWAIFHFARNTTFTLQDILKFEGLKRVETCIWMTHGVLSQLGVNVTSTCVDVTFTQTLTQLLSGILKLIRWCFVSKLDVLFKINVTFQRLKKTMLLQAIVELPSLKPTVRTWKWMDGKPEARPLFRGSGARVLLAPKSDLTALWLDLKSSRLHLRRWVIPANDSRKILS